MTRSEINEWIEAHYDELLAVAKRRTRGLEDAQDAVHQAVGRALESETLATLEPHKAWLYFSGAVASACHIQHRGRRRAQSAVGRAGALLSTGGKYTPLRHVSEEAEAAGAGGQVAVLSNIPSRESEPDADLTPRAWFVGPYGWRSIGSDLPRLKPPAPDAPFAEYSIQPDGDCPRCEARMVVRLNRGRDYDKVHGRLPCSFYVATCLNGHEFSWEPVLTPHEFGSSWNNDKPERPRQFWERFDGGKALPSMEALYEDSRRPRWK